MSRSWTTSTSHSAFPIADRERSEDMLRARGTSLGPQFRQTLVECLHEAGVDATRLDRFPHGRRRRHRHLMLIDQGACDGWAVRGEADHRAAGW